MGPIHGSLARKITVDFVYFLNDYLQHGCISRLAALLSYSAKYDCSDLDRTPLGSLDLNQCLHNSWRGAEGLTSQSRRAFCCLEMWKRHWAADAQIRVGFQRRFVSNATALKYWEMSGKCCRKTTHKIKKKIKKNLFYEIICRSGPKYHRRRFSCISAYCSKPPLSPEEQQQQPNRWHNLGFQRGSSLGRDDILGCFALR